MTVRKEQSKSIIVTTDKEFKQKTVNFLNNIGFPAEKFTVDSASELFSKADLDHTVRNIVIDAQNCFPRDEDMAKKLAHYGKKPRFKILVYAEPETVEELEKDATFSPCTNLFFAKLPFDKRAFNDAFHGAISGSKFPSSNLQKRRAPTGKVDDGTPKNLSAFEASAHVKDTIGMINELAKDKQEFKTVSLIGQRFNGLIGTFAFYGDKPGWKELRQIGQQIDCIARTYQLGDKGPVADKHFELLVNLAKSAFIILQDLRNAKEPQKAELEKATAMTNLVDKDPDIINKTALDQESIDSLLTTAS